MKNEESNREVKKSVGSMEEEMKRRTRNSSFFILHSSFTLLMLFWGMIIIPVITAMLYETNILLAGDFAGDGYERVEFTATIVMELLTLIEIPSALRLFKMAGDKICDEPSLMRFSLIRFAILLVPLWGNTLLYYLFMNATFGYMAIITLIAMVFVYPAKQQFQNDGSED